MAKQSACALILLAAGASTRMGRPKQLLPINGRPLLRLMAETALSAPVAPVLVVLGANAAEIAPCLDGLPVNLVMSAAWSEGMSASLRTGMEALIASHPHVENVIIALADQPDLSADHLAKLIEAQTSTGQPIVASDHDGVRGPPVLFAAKYFPALRALSGEAGARSILKAHAHDVAAVSFPAARDLDTPADFTDYLGRNAPVKE